MVFLHFHFHYEKVYQDKKFSKFCIKTLILVAWLKYKNY